MLEFVLRAAAMYFMALLMVRLLGKRALGELGPFDFVVMTGVGHTVVSVALDRQIPFYEGIIILLTLAVLEYLMGYAALKSHKLSNLIVGKPILLIDNGRIIKSNLAREKFNVDDLLQELRKQGVRDIDEVDKGVLESCGGFSVILKEEDEPVTLRDLGLKPVNRNEIPTTGILSRAEFFACQEQESVQDQGFMLEEMLAKIEARLDLIYHKVESLEKKAEQQGK